MQDDFNDFVKNEWGKKNEDFEKWYYEQEKDPNSLVSWGNKLFYVFGVSMVFWALWKSFHFGKQEPIVTMY
jgi:hypothetical protein